MARHGGIIHAVDHLHNASGSTAPACFVMGYREFIWPWSAMVGATLILFTETPQCICNQRAVRKAVWFDQACFWPNAQSWGPQRGVKLFSDGMQYYYRTNRKNKMNEDWTLRQFLKMFCIIIISKPEPSNFLVECKLQRLQQNPLIAR